MNQNINPQSSKQLDHKDNKYQLSLDILSSIKSLPGKLINLESNNAIPKNKDRNKNNYFIDDHIFVANINKFTNTNFAFDMKQKTSFTSNSVFKPIENHPYNFQNKIFDFHSFNPISPKFEFNNTFINPYISINSFSTRNSYSLDNSKKIHSNKTISNSLKENPINQQHLSTPIKIILNEENMKKNKRIRKKVKFLLNRKRNIENANTLRDLKDNDDVIKKNNIFVLIKIIFFFYK